MLPATDRVYSDEAARDHYVGTAHETRCVSAPTVRPDRPGAGRRPASTVGRNSFPAAPIACEEVPDGGGTIRTRTSSYGNFSGEALATCTTASSRLRHGRPTRRRELLLGVVIMRGETGFLDCIGAALLSGEDRDEVDAAFDAVSGFEDDDWTADTCASSSKNLTSRSSAARGRWVFATTSTRPGSAASSPRRSRFAQNGVDCPIDCDAVIGTPSRPSTQPPTEPGDRRGPRRTNDSDGALGLTTTLRRRRWPSRPRSRRLADARSPHPIPIRLTIPPPPVGGFAFFPDTVSAIR